MYTNTAISINGLCAPVLTSDPFYTAIITAVNKAIFVYKRRFELMSCLYDFKNIPFNPTLAEYQSEDILSQFLDYESDMEEYITLLTDFCKGFGYNPNLELVTDAFTTEQKARILIQEAESIIWKIQHKGSSLFYEYIFKLYSFVGKTYVMLLKDNQYIRSLDWPTIEASLLARTVIDNSPFLDMTENNNVSAMTLQELKFDEGLVFDDEETPWYFDQYLDTVPTQHIAIEYVVGGKELVNGYALFEDSGNYYTSIPSLLSYMRKFVDYGKKATVVPHVGIQFNIPMYATRYKNLLPSATHTIPSLMTDAMITDQYATFVSGSDRVMDTSGLVMDDSPSIYMDEGSIQESDKAATDIFYAVVVGTGAKDVVTQQFKDIYTNKVLFTSFDNTTITNYGDNYTFATTGTPIVTNEGWSNKAWQISSGIYATSTSNVIHPSSVASIMVWLSKDLTLQAEGSTETIFEWDNCHTLQVERVSVDEWNLIWSIDVLSGSPQVVTTAITEMNGLYVLMLEQVDTEVIADVYYEGTSINTLTVTDTFSGSGIFTIGYTTTGYIGSISDVNVMRKKFTEEELIYLTANHIGPMYSLAHEVNRKVIALDDIREIMESSEETADYVYRTVSASLYAFSYWEEIGVGDTNENTYSLNISKKQVSASSPIEQGFTRVSIVSEGVTYTLTDSANNGILTQEVILDPNGDPTPLASRGTVNYLTGEVGIVTEFEYIYASSTEHPYNLGSGTSFSEPIPGFSLDANEKFISSVANSMQISWDLLGNTHTAYNLSDDSFASQVGVGFDGGSFNPSTGSLSLSFNTSVDNVTVTYFTTYRYINLDTGSPISASYKVVDSDYTITEAGVVDPNGVMTVYATFPPIQFYDKYDHVNFNFMIRKV